jgi:hypothetical protein
MNRSMSDFGQEAALTSGGATSLIGWNDQKRRCSSVIRYGPPFAFASEGAAFASGQGRPIATHRVRTSTSRSFSFSLGGILGSSL